MSAAVDPESPTQAEPQPGQGIGAEDEVDDDGDLFGDEEDDDLGDDNERAKNRRRLDDEDLDSGDDEHRNDRVAQSVEGNEHGDDDDDDNEAEFHELRTMNVQFARVTRPVGNELYLFNLPPFLGLSHMEFHPSSYEAPTKPHDPSADSNSNGSAAGSSGPNKFSAYDTAMSTMYWRHDPKSPSLLQSNARIIRWSDGSLTLQLASDPTKQYALSATPLHQNYNAKSNRLGPAHSNQSYDPTQDSNNYLVAPHATAGFDYQIVRPLDAALKVLPTADQDKAAKLILQQALHKSKNSTFDPFTNVKTIRVDPEKAKRDAERAEKEIAATKRMAANAQDRDLNRRERVLGSRTGLGSSRGGGGGGGLSIADLEGGDDDDNAHGTNARSRSSKTAKSRRPKRNRRGSIYSDDEDENLPRGRTKEDEYDREDDFVAASDEELETYESEDEVEGEGEDAEEEDQDAEGEIEDDPAAAAAAAARAREGTPKRAAADENEDGGGGGGAAAGRAGSPQARKKRRVIDDDDDDEDE